MKIRFYTAALGALLVLASGAGSAGEPVDKAQFERVRAALEVKQGGLKVGSVRTSDVPGLLEVQFENGPLVYASPDGQYFLVGDLYTSGPAGFVNLSEKQRDVQRKEQMAGVKLEDMIVFSPEGETRAHINVFTDTSCFYCQKLHKEVPELNRRGVEVRYLAYPRAGVGSAGYKQLVTAWCADNPQEALTRLKNKEKVAEKTCDPNPVAAEYALGQQLGVRGTPAIITETGEMIPGYQNADSLMVILGLAEDK